MAVKTAFEQAHTLEKAQNTVLALPPLQWMGPKQTESATRSCVRMRTAQVLHRGKSHRV